jgi:hypothetical protein
MGGGELTTCEREAFVIETALIGAAFAYYLISEPASHFGTPKCVGLADLFYYKIPKYGHHRRSLFLSSSSSQLLLFT